MNKLLTLSAGAALLGTTAIAQTSYPAAIQGQIERLAANGFSVTEVERGFGRNTEIKAIGPDGRRYELELEGNRWRMELDDDEDDEDDEEDDDDEFDDEDDDDEDDEDDRDDDEDDDEDERDDDENDDDENDDDENDDDEDDDEDDD